MINIYEKFHFLIDGIIKLEPQKNKSAYDSVTLTTVNGFCGLNNYVNIVKIT